VKCERKSDSSKTVNEQEVGTVMETTLVVSLGNEKLCDTSMRLEDEERGVTFLNSSKH
jgi:hypothetical protein